MMKRKKGQKDGEEVIISAALKRKKASIAMR
jgi:hypothetical protein